MSRKHVFIGDGLRPSSGPHKNKNYDNRLFFDRLSWGFFFFRENPNSKIISEDKYFLINDPSNFVSDAKTTIMETRRSFWYLINFCDFVENLDDFKFAKKGTGVLSSAYRTVKEDDENFQEVSEIVEELCPDYMSKKEKNYVESCSRRMIM